MTEDQIDFYRQAAINGSLPDELNPIYIFSLTKVDLLVMIASQKLDASFLALKELEQRGLDQHGVWVGFKDHIQNERKEKSRKGNRKNRL
ncbi:hypothetical protein [Chitinophaga sp. OAE865]|uniref:hypothetical protein n=1 Tax=Chitinophaga sp. OAE865 TaxID=2817898 RepID=UPI001AEA4AE5